MNILMMMVPISFALGVTFLVLFLVSLNQGQFDDAQTPALRILKDEESIEKVNFKERL